MVETQEVAGFLPDVLSYNDYYPYGMLLPKRHASDESYRYGFQGQEKDDELKGEGNSLNYTFRMHYPRIGRWLSLDPLAEKYPNESNYNSFGNNPILYIDPDGRDIIIYLSNGKYFKYTPGMTVPNDEFGIKVVEALNDIYSTDEGQIVVCSLVNSHRNYNIKTIRGFDKKKQKR